MIIDTSKPLEKGDPCWLYRWGVCFPVPEEYRGQQHAFPWDKKQECQEFINEQRALLNPRYTGD